MTYYKSDSERRTNGAKTTYKDFSGMRFGRLTVIERIGSTKNQKSLFLCKCDCGNMVKVVGGNLTSGTSKSCGCYKKDMQHNRANPQRIRLKRIHRLMIIRCNDKESKSYTRYGGRGIKVCKEWQESFEKFYEWAISNGYSDNLTLDRKNNDLGYCPENCRWATYEQQANNTSRVHIVDYNNEKMSISMFARKIGADVRRVNYLINRGYSTEQVKEKVSNE